jgi:hypothetical protein
MLGHQLCRILAGQMDVWATFRSIPAQFEFLPAERMIDHVQVEDITRVKDVIDIVKPDELFSAGEWVRLATEAVKEILARGKLPILSGGTGFYIEAFREGLSEGIAPDPEVRDTLEKELRMKGPVALHTKLVSAPSSLIMPMMASAFSFFVFLSSTNSTPSIRPLPLTSPTILLSCSKSLRRPKTSLPSDSLYSTTLLLSMYSIPASPHAQDRTFPRNVPT